MFDTMFETLVASNWRVIKRSINMLAFKESVQKAMEDFNSRA